MPRTDEAESFFHAVYAAVQEIPPGKVTSYGHIARLIGTPQRPRQVGVCLKHLPAPTSPNTPSTPRHNSTTVPWQRVISAKGTISPRSHPGGAGNQAEVLRAEGVTVARDAMGVYAVDLGLFGWFPKVLPSVEAEGGWSGSESESGSGSGDDEGTEVGGDGGRR